MRSVSKSALLVIAAFAACKKEDPPPSYPAPSYQPQSDPRWSAPPTAPAPTAPPAPAAPPPAAGFFCASDADLQCPFAHCVSGRCGGCASSSDCKPGSICAPTWVGLACLPGTPAPAPIPAPAPSLPPAPSPAPAPSLPSASPLSLSRARCTDRINSYRSTVVGAAPLARRPDAESCADNAAQSDAQSRSVHGAFGRCNESAQNECPAWSGALDTVIDQCIDMMFAEGPGSGSAHGHYVNMTNRSYSGVACGIANGPHGEVWIVQNYYR